MGIKKAFSVISKSARKEIIGTQKEKPTTWRLLQFLQRKLLQLRILQRKLLQILQVPLFCKQILLFYSFILCSCEGLEMFVHGLFVCLCSNVLMGLKLCNLWD